MRQFREQAREWLEKTVPEMPVPPAADDWAGRREYDALWQRKVFDAGYAGMAWPKEYGGRGATPMEELAFAEEAERAGAPDIGMHFPGQLFIGPTIIRLGTDEQKRRWLPSTLSGDTVWCQGFSEPDAGSDLASLSTRAVRDGNHYVVTGQKVWTSFSPVADLCELLVRTDRDAPKHKGITCLVVPMDSPGIQVRPLRTIVGNSEFGEVFFDEVRVPVDNVLGEVNGGWKVAMVTVEFERGSAFARSALSHRRTLSRIKDIARSLPTGDGGVVWDDHAVRARVGELSARVGAVWAMLVASVERSEQTGVLGLEGSYFKLAHSELAQDIGAAVFDVLGASRAAPEVVPGALELVRESLQALSFTIAGGTSDIQRNIISEGLLGLPRVS